MCSYVYKPTGVCGQTLHRSHSAHAVVPGVTPYMFMHCAHNTAHSNISLVYGSACVFTSITL